MSSRLLCALAGVLLFSLPAPLLAQPAASVLTLKELKKLSLDELLMVEVTSVSRHAETATRAAAAVEVVTQLQVARTGATTVPDALRLVPGVQVSRFGGHSFALSSRGFASLAANKLQVMQDGRSLYSPLFSGVFWDGYGAMMEDIDRIEVIRGPGSTMWGANAVNGVINILTKDARDTQGGLVTFGGGSEERLFGAVRVGGTAGPSTHYRVYARFHDRDPLILPGGQPATASPFETQAGFRLDTRRAGGNHLTFQGDYFQNEAEVAPDEDAANRSINLLGRWRRMLPAGGEWQVQGYFDRFERTVPRQMGDRRNTFDLDAQYRTRVGQRHDIITGFNYRLSSDHTDAGGTTQFEPRGRVIEIVSALVQDEITLAPGRLALVVGSKFQWDSLGGFEPQPTLRAVWTPAERQTVWAAISRAVRMPTRIDEDLRFVPNPTAGVVLISGNPDFQPEKLHAFELGYRVRPMNRLFIDATVFHHDYDDLRSLEPTLPAGIPLVQFNRLEATTTGAEVSVKVDVAPWWGLSGNYTWLRRRLLPRADSRDPNRGTLEGNDASRLWSLWSSMDFPGRITLDLMLRHVGPLPQPVVPGYTELDARVAWRASDALELALVGQNLLDPQHREFGPPSPGTAEVQRGFYAKATWRF